MYDKIWIIANSIRHISHGYRDYNSLSTNHSTQLTTPPNTGHNPFYQSAPVSCCWTLVDPQTGWPSPTYKNLHQCQHYEFGPPNLPEGGHNDAIYYRVRHWQRTDALHPTCSYRDAPTLSRAIWECMAVVLAVSQSS